MAQAKTTTTLVRSAVARFESTCATPTLARSAVAAAKAAERSAHPIQLMGIMVRGGEGGRARLIRNKNCIALRCEWDNPHENASSDKFSESAPAVAGMAS